MNNNKGLFLIIIAIVIFSYAAFSPSLAKLFLFTKNPPGYYQSLTKGFLSGQLSMSTKPSKELLSLQDPYDPAQNKKYYLNDLSLYNGKYYVYFGPLPALTFFMPIKVLTGYYASNSLAVFFYLSIGFIIMFLTLIKIKEYYFPKLSNNVLIPSGLMIAFASTAPYLLARPAIYEVAISSAFCCMSIALFFLLKLLHETSAKNISLFSLFLALTVACRPHFVLICILFVTGISIYLLKKNEKKSLLFALLLPALCIGSALALYNYFRFDSIFEFGQKYQLNAYKNTLLHVSSETIFQNLKTGLFIYFIQPYFFAPIIKLPNGYSLEPTAGILLSVPFVFLALFMPAQMYIYLKQKKQIIPSLQLFILFVSLIPIIIVSFLASLPCVTHRYEMDFLPYMIMLSIISMWLINTNYANSRWLTIINRVYISAAAIGITSGIALAAYRNFTYKIWVTI